MTNMTSIRQEQKAFRVFVVSKCVLYSFCIPHLHRSFKLEFLSQCVNKSSYLFHTRHSTQGTLTLHVHIFSIT
jgi:hypothetical protein